MSTKKVTKKVGRPTKYKEEYCQQMIDYFNQPLYVYEAEERMSASGAIKEVMVKRANDIPLFEAFAFDICGVCDDTIREWRDIHPEFSSSYKIAKGFQKRFIKTHALSKNYSEGFSKFFAINNLGMVEKSELKTENEHKHEGYGLAFDLTRKPE